MKTGTKIFTRIATAVFVGLLLLSFSVAPVYAYDAKKCATAVKRLKVLLKPYRSLKIKEIYKEIDKLDDQEGGVDSKVVEGSVEPPFEKLS